MGEKNIMNWYKRIIIAGLPAWNLREFIKKLKEYNVQHIRNAKGDDQLWGIPGTDRQTTIPFGPGGRTINPWTMSQIVRDLQLPLSDFKKKDHKKKEVVPEPVQEQKPEVIPDWQKSKWYQEQQSSYCR
jgi:predicted RNA binding protein YcfA (HicA-like mRNA interferase family)